MGPTKICSCGAEILFARTAKGKLIPIEVCPAEDGNLLLTITDTGLEARYITGSEQLPDWKEPRYKSHFATCPDSAKWRRR